MNSLITTRHWILCLLLSLFAAVRAAPAQQLPLVTSFSQNGVLVCSNLQPLGVGVVEWASTLSGPWTNSWAALAAVVADSNGAISVSVPMFYRVRTSPPPTNGMVPIPAGAYIIGNSIGDSDITDADPTNVYVSAFYMDVNFVTFGLWQAVYNVATNSLGYGFYTKASAPGTNYPATGFTWIDWTKWCNARSQLEGLTPVYYTDPGFTLVFTNETTIGITPDNRPYVNWNANGYRIPTEAEWEKAARGGLIGQRFPWGNTISESQANYDGDTTDYSYDLGPAGFNTLGFGGDGATPVGTFPLNGYGLADMAGNLQEFCYDWYSAPPYPAGSPYLGGTDPTGPASSTLYYVTRGGGCSLTANYARCANRLAKAPAGGGGGTGLRCVRRP